MKELTDLEICKRIAEIEGLNAVSRSGKLILVKDVPLTMNGRMYHELNVEARNCYDNNNEYNPLTDDALCFQLMVNHEVHTGHYGEHEAEVFIDNCMNVTADKSVNKAICLAIIEAHDEPNNK